MVHRSLSIFLTSIFSRHIDINLYHIRHIVTDLMYIVSLRVPYLCTGYDLYITREPCLMCSMALIHSRFRRVFYCVSNAERGALSTSVALHLNNNLNHSYRVFQMSGPLHTLSQSLLADHLHPIPS